MPKLKVLILDREDCIPKLYASLTKLNLDLEIHSTSTILSARKILVNIQPHVMFMGVDVDHSRGLYFLNKLMRHFPIPVVMLSDKLNPKLKKQCLLQGAIDALDRESMFHIPVDYLKCVNLDIVDAQSFMNNRRIFTAPNTDDRPQKRKKFNLIGIGSSTGGTEALASIFERVSGGLPPIVIAQHMPPEFTGSFADRLNGLGPLNVKEAEHGEPIKRGWAYVAPGKTHMALKRSSTQTVINISRDLGDHKYSPSVDVLFHSISSIFGSKSLAFLLTGMGKDGADGLKMIRKKGGHTIAQDEASSAIYGMPKEAMLLDACDCDMPLSEIPRYINQLFSEEETPRMGNLRY